MAIDLLSETLIPLSAVPGFLAKRGGRRVSERTVRQWAAVGRLETVRLGVRHTSEEALQRMVMEGKRETRKTETASTLRRRQRTRRDHERRQEAAMEELKKYGVV